MARCPELGRIIQCDRGAVADLSFVSRVFALVWLLGLFGVPAMAAPLTPAAVLSAQDRAVRVEGTVELLYQEESEALSPQQVMSPALADRWAVYPGKKINLSRQRLPVWIRFTVRNEAPATKAWVLGIEWPMIDRIELHPLDPVTGEWGAVQRSGAAVAADSKPMKDPAFVFPLQVPQGTSMQYVMRVQSHAAFFVPLLISDATEFQQRRFDTAVLMGVLFGVLGVMFLYNAALALFVRERSYAVYGVYLLTVLLYELTITGYGAMYLWSRLPWLMLHAYELFACASFLSAALFFRYFLDLRNARPPHLRYINTAIVGYWAFALMVTAVWPNRALSASIALVGLLSSFVCVYTSVVLIAQGNRYARYFGAAWSVLVVATVASLLSLFGVLEGNWLTNNAQHIGFVAEVLLLSVALADRIKREREVREAAQREALELTERVEREREAKILAQAHAIAVQRKANEDLEVRVLDRTAELERAMKNLEIANVELAKLSVTDALTKVHNRRYFDEVLEKEYHRSERTQVPLAVVLVDIDHFKRVNDSCGHLAGDECLRLVATALRQTAARSTDLVARYGGEEFALVLPGTDAGHAVEMADRVRQAVERIDFIYRGRRVPISVSLGVVAKVVSLDQPVDDFVAEADAALYRAKEAGRNRVMLAA